MPPVLSWRSGYAWSSVLCLPSCLAPFSSRLALESSLLLCVHVCGSYPNKHPKLSLLGKVFTGLSLFFYLKVFFCVCVDTKVVFPLHKTAQLCSAHFFFLSTGAREPNLGLGELQLFIYFTFAAKLTTLLLNLFLCSPQTLTEVICTCCQVRSVMGKKREWLESSWVKLHHVVEKYL